MILTHQSLEQILQVHVSQHMPKKMLVRPDEFISLGRKYDFIYAMMCQAELKERFESQIDYAQCKREKSNLYISLKKKTRINVDMFPFCALSS